jgi:hypothetical protein
LERDPDDLRGVGHFQVQPCVNPAPQLANVAILDMTPILAKVGRNAVRSGGFGSERSLDRAGLTLGTPAITRLPDSGHVVNIDAKLQHAGLSAKEERV